MAEFFRQTVSLVALLAFMAGVAQVQPCLEEDECALSCSSLAASACAASADHDDPKPQLHSCDCMCHVPAVAMNGPAVVRADDPIEMHAVSIGIPSSLGAIASPFRPPRT
jgi:hypothetical protein